MQSKVSDLVNKQHQMFEFFAKEYMGKKKKIKTAGKKKKKKNGLNEKKNVIVVKDSDEEDNLSALDDYEDEY